MADRFLAANATRQNAWRMQSSNSDYRKINRNIGLNAFVSRWIYPQKPQGKRTPSEKKEKKINCSKSIKSSGSCKKEKNVLTQKHRNKKTAKINALLKNAGLLEAISNGCKHGDRASQSL